MSACDECGEEITFRWINGTLTPLQLYCSCKGRSIQEHPITTHKLDSDPNEFCRLVSCDYCGDNVFFVRHNGGSFWVNSLGWPWPKHECYNSDNRRKGRHPISLGVKHDRSSLLGIVIEVQERPDHISDVATILCEDGKQGSLCIAYIKNSQELLGELVVISRGKDELFCRFGVFDIVGIPFYKIQREH